MSLTLIDAQDLRETLEDVVMDLGKECRSPVIENAVNIINSVIDDLS